jgi:hypothetical protein
MEPSVRELTSRTLGSYRFHAPWSPTIYLGGPVVGPTKNVVPGLDLPCVPAMPLLWHYSPLAGAGWTLYRADLRGIQKPTSLCGQPGH